jgi:CO/xanthine dehydrogenase FAD-binding subunit
MQNPHPGLPEMDYVKPVNLEEASRFLVAHAGEARPFLGATDCIVRLRDGAWKAKYLVDVKGLDGTRDLVFDPQKGLTIGAAVPMNQLEATPVVQEYYPGLVEACHWVASYQLRSRATVVGNICNASPAGDTIGAAMLYEGVLKVFGPAGYREEPLSTFFKGPGKTVLQPGDIAVSLFLPLPPAGHVSRYLKLGRNRLGDLAIVGVTVMGYPDAGVPSGLHYRIHLASVAPIPLRVPKAEDILANKKLDEAVIAEAAQAAMDSCTPIDDTRGSARYRKLMVRNLTRNAVTDVWTKIR